MKNFRHNRGKGSKGSGSSLLDIFSSAGLSREPGAHAAMMEDDDICPTCLDPYTLDNPKIWTRCGHHFHMPCIFEWMERKDTCPMCESKMVLVDDDLDMAP